jgi:DNA-binding response OmpR family regulator
MGGVTSLAREPRPQQKAGWLTAGNIAVDLDGFRVVVAEARVDLTFQEFELLKVLLSQPDSIVQYDELALALWGSAGGRKRRRLGVLICRLRAKLAASHPYRFETVRGRGYGLVAPLGNSGPAKS